MKLFWENFEINWKNDKIIILETFWKFFGIYVPRVSFVKQIFELFAQNFEEMLEIYRKFLRNFGWIM